MSLVLDWQLEGPGKFHWGFQHRCSAKRNVFGRNDDPLTLNMRSNYISGEKVLLIEVETS